jgi:prepilin-type N-terminal cleavage/methylation domain-containing protein
MRKILEKINFDKKKSGKSGFTLIELLLYMGIFSIFLVIILQMFTTIFDVQTESEATSSVSADGKYILERFSYDVNQATSVSTPSSYGTNSATLTFVSNAKTLTYSLVNGDLILQNTTDNVSGQLNSNETTVSNLSFIKLNGGGKDAVQMSFTLTSEATKRSGKEVVNFQTSGGIR